MIRLVPRGVLDIGWNHLLSSLIQTLLPNPNTEPPGTPGTLATLSVRTALDLYLQHLNAEPGDEVIMSAISIPEMFAIVEAHQLRVVPVPVRFSDLSIHVEDIRAAMSARTRMIVIAPLFGVRFSLQPIAQLAATQGIPVLEDCAQAWHGHATLKDFCQNSSDGAVAGEEVSRPSSVETVHQTIQLYSFGPIKTATALGGAIIVDADQNRLSAIAARQSQYAMVSRTKSLRRLLRYLVLKQLSTPTCFGLFARLCRLFGHDYDEVLFRMTRGFPGTGLLEKFRGRLNIPQQKLLFRRFLESHDHWIHHRNQFAEELLSLIDRNRVPGMSARLSKTTAIHNHWVIPFESSNPDHLIRELRNAGFDATRRASSLVHHGGSLRWQSSDHDPDMLTAARLANLVYLPNYPKMTSRELHRMVSIINATSAGTGVSS